MIKNWLSKEDKEVRRQRKPWEKDYLLEELGQHGLFYEYLEICK